MKLRHYALIVIGGFATGFALGSAFDNQPNNQQAITHTTENGEPVTILDGHGTLTRFDCGGHIGSSFVHGGQADFENAGVITLGGNVGCKVLP